MTRLLVNDCISSGVCHPNQFDRNRVVSNAYSGLKDDTCTKELEADLNPK